MRGDDDVAEVLGSGGAPRAEQRVLLRRMLDVAAAEVRVVLLDAHRDVVQREAVLREQRRIDDDLKLLGLSTPGVHLTHAGNGPQLRLDHPLMEILQLHRAHRARQRVLIELAERGRRQPERWLDAGRQLRRDLLQALGHELPPEVHRHRIVKDHRDHRETELR